MNSKASSDIEPKLEGMSSIRQRELQISSRLMEALSDVNGRSISRTTGYNSETVRRYLNGDSKVPADFVAQVVRRYDKDVFRILNIDHTMSTDDLHHIPLNQLMNEVSRRICRIEDYSVGSVLVGQHHPLDHLSTKQD